MSERLKRVGLELATPGADDGGGGPPCRGGAGVAVLGQDDCPRAAVVWCWYAGGVAAGNQMVNELSRGLLRDPQRRGEAGGSGVAPGQRSEREPVHRSNVVEPPLRKPRLDAVNQRC